MSEHLSFIEDSLHEAAKIAGSYFGKVSGTVKPEDFNQVLTEADIAIGKFLVSAAQEMFPNYNIIDEEAGVIDQGANLTWVFDPMEATSNFAAGLSQYGIMLGLLDGTTPIAGGVIAPEYKKIYLAEKGKGATCNGEQITVTQEEDLINTLVSFGIDGHQEDPERTRLESEVFADIVLSARNIRNSGCEATDTMYVAEGRYGGRINFSAKIWDVVAPQVITEEAGARFTAADGKLIDYTNPLTKTEQNFTFCVASPLLHQQLQAIINNRFSS